MKRLYLIFTYFLISQLLIGQSDSLVIRNKKNNEKTSLKKGEKIKVKLSNNESFRGNLEMFYDSSLNVTQLKIDNKTIPFELIKTIKHYRLNKYEGIITLVCGGLIEFWSLYKYKDSWFGELFLLTAAVAVIPIIAGTVSLINTHRKTLLKKKKYEFLL
tara:strand:+ start:127 stop:603 length:477 start_codon:yes stop_codon:yes gene_type:complete